MMTRYWISLILAASISAAPLAAVAAEAKSPATTKKPAQTAAKTKKAAKPAGKSAHAGHSHGPSRSTAPAASAQPKPGAPLPVSSKNTYQVPQARTLSETPDVVLNSRVRASLLAALSTNGQDILAKTTKGVVTLSGSVASAPLRARAEQAAKKVRGVRAVKNQITVKSAARVSKR
jgi:hyperosmotically inducible periplasmic protein